MNLLNMIRFNDTFLFTVGLAAFIGGYVFEEKGWFFVFGLCTGTLIRHAIQDLKKKK